MDNFLKKYKSTDSPILRGGQSLFRAAPTEIAPVDGAENTFKFIITTNKVDRYGDIVEPSGMDATNYLQNPVVLFNHMASSDMLPIGQSLSLETTSDGTGIVSTAKFHTDTELARNVIALLNGGYLRATSIGFRPTEWLDMPPENGDTWNCPRRYTKWNLLEYSVVNIPANPYALITNNFVRGIGEGMERGLFTSESAIVKHIAAIMANGVNGEVKSAVEKELTTRHTIPTIPTIQPEPVKKELIINIKKAETMTKTKSIDPSQVTTAQSEITQAVTDAVNTHLAGYGVDATEAQEIGAACGAICALIYGLELGAEEAAEEMPTAENTPPVSDAPKSFSVQMVKAARLAAKEIKAGSTFSGATKGKLKAMLESATAHTKLVKALHDEAHASKEESAPTPQVRKLTLDEAKKIYSL